MTTEIATATTAGIRAPQFTVGDIACHVISDGYLAYPPEFLFANAEPTELQAALRGRVDDEGTMNTPYHCLLLRTPTATVLVDTGLGQHAATIGPSAGHLMNGLAAAGFSPADIDTVVISHAHADHIGGLVTDQALTFPTARHVMSRTEWEFWTSEDTLASLPEALAAPARAVLPPLLSSDQLDLTDGETEIVDGVRLLPAPGHTPGHCVIAVTSGGASLTFLADAILDELQFRHLHWVSAVDMSVEDTVRTRTRLLDQAAAEESVVMAYHMAATGHVERSTGAYRLVPPQQAH